MDNRGDSPENIKLQEAKTMLNIKNRKSGRGSAADVYSLQC